MQDTYPSIKHLMQIEAHHVRIQWIAERRSRIAVVAPHAGRIEPVTGELAAAVAGDEHRLYCFYGAARSNNARLHVTSTRFVEPGLSNVLHGAVTVIAIHGSRAPRTAVTLIGGRNRALGDLAAAQLRSAGFQADEAAPPVAGYHPDNLVNRALDGGVQLEISRLQRDVLGDARSTHHDPSRADCDCGFCRYVGAVRRGLSAYLSLTESIRRTQFDVRSA